MDFLLSILVLKIVLSSFVQLFFVVFGAHEGPAYVYVVDLVYVNFNSVWREVPAIDDSIHCEICSLAFLVTSFTWSKCMSLLSIMTLRYLVVLDHLVIVLPSLISSLPYVCLLEKRIAFVLFGLIVIFHSWNHGTSRS